MRYHEGRQYALEKLGFEKVAVLPQIAAAYGARHVTPQDQHGWGSAIGHGIIGSAIGMGPGALVGAPLGAPGAVLGGIGGAYLGGRLTKKILDARARASGQPVLGVGYDQDIAKGRKGRSLKELALGDSDERIKERQKEGQIKRAGEVITAPIQEELAKRVFDPKNEVISPKVTEYLHGRADDMGIKRIPVGSPAYLPESKTIIGDPRVVDSFAHELGHGIWDSKLPGKVMQNKHLYNMGKLSPVAGLVSGMYAADEVTRGEDPNLLRDAAIVGGTATPMLASEGAASLYGLSELRKAKLSQAKYLKARKNLLRAFGTYALYPAAGAINYGAMRYGLPFLHDLGER